MRVRFVAFTIAISGGCLFAGLQPPPPAEPQQMEAIDFDALRAQATTALETLQQSHERRVVAAPSHAL